MPIFLWLNVNGIATFDAHLRQSFIKDQRRQKSGAAALVHTRSGNACPDTDFRKRSVADPVQP
jgi:hypothetical protein